MRPSERIQQYRKPPVETSMVMKTIILLSVFLFYTELGMLQAALFPKGSAGFGALLNLGLAVLGLIFRYLLEFGEVSNTYNFTAPNVVLHLFILTLLPVMTYVSQKQKS